MVYGECGGLVYLSQSLTPAEGTGRPPRAMCGLAPFATRAVPAGRGLHSSTFQLNLEPFLTQSTPKITPGTA